MTQHSESLGANVESERALVLVAYVLHLIGSVSALPSIVGLIVNYLKRPDGDSLLRSHHDWMIRTFWWALFWVVIGWIARFVLIGYAILALVWLWFVYRHILGLIRLANGEPPPQR
ncbi:MAG TPA: hypothetical protein VF329_02915 [Gammaproteobacteria bacterium]